MNRQPFIAVGVFAFALLVIVVVLASLYGVSHNCSDEEEDEPAMLHYNDIKQDVMLGTRVSGGESFIKTIAYSSVPGKEMQAGILQLDSAQVLSYPQWYEGIVFVVSGEVSVSDGSNVTLSGKLGESFYIPRGTQVTYKSKHNDVSVLYYVQQLPSAEDVEEIQTAMINNGGGGNGKTTVVKQPKYDTFKLPLFENKQNSLSYLKDILFSKVKGKEITGGLYELKPGPALDYRYPYEEFKYIVQGEFHLKDGSGKSVVANAGDLMYFPKGTWVRFTSPATSLGFYVGQRVADSA